MVAVYKEKLKGKMHVYVRFVYKITRSFPKEEMYGAISQMRRATMSVVLNYIEGYARRKPLSQLHFLEIAYGSLKESKYLLYFAKEEDWISKEEHKEGSDMAEEIGAMLWTEITSLSKSTEDE